MHLHANAKLGLAGRRALVQSIAGGCSIRAGCCELQRLAGNRPSLVASLASRQRPEHASLACLLDRSSRPRRSPSRLAPALERAICDCRRQTGWGPRLVAGATGFAHSTVWKVLRRARDLASAQGRARAG